MKHVKLKVCCISSVEEAELAISLGADAIGLVAQMPSGPGVIGDDLIREIVTQVPAGIETFLLTSRTTAKDIAAHVNECGTSTVQIVQHIDPREYEALDRLISHVKKVQVIHVEDRQSIDLITQYESHVDAFLLDSGRPNASMVTLGGTGNTHDWSISKLIVKQTNTPVYLAGGLNPANVSEAISTVAPFGVDLCSGVRTEGKLDASLLKQFVSDISN